jgi:hypothetical protein
MLPDAIAAVVEAWYEAQTDGNPLDLLISAINNSPKIKSSFIAIERRGARLGIRARLPPKSGLGRRFSQRISLGLSADEHNAKVAEILVLLIIDQLKRDDFRWDRWTDDEYIEKIVSSASLTLNPSPAAT